MKGNKYNDGLLAALEHKNVLIMAHRGVSCANIVDNTIESYDAAIHQGADIVEVDVCASLDGDLFVLHDGMEPVVLGQQESIIHMHTPEIRKLRYLNKNNTRIDHPINTLDEVLEHLKGRRSSRLFSAMGWQTRSFSRVRPRSGISSTWPIRANRFCICRSYGIRKK